VRIARDHRIPLYLHKRIYANIVSGSADIGIDELAARQLLLFHQESRFRIGEFLVFPFGTHHRAGCVTMALGFCVVSRGRKIGYITDCGMIDENIVAALRGSHVAVIEANHQVQMVKNGTRHWAAKQWVLSNEGHLSNDAAADLISRISGPGGALRHVLLAHISEDHNVLDGLTGLIARLVTDSSVKLSVTYHHARSETIEAGEG
jgi:phosphoribosyl 1,2-cyclic phosphodiesterase